ncbi:MAG TPA: TonB-dependent receptor [Phenylobacterium sp.]|jgi:iron complex outermembrane receptor protein|uniref:TonB-dependent receptor domain-containing protein n=1 Tax=Phenylobacterium sp. TaxID=1871053 RepID=UPI002C937379|nr:TonB-dependent receptor [Phenylobacterium sp.]HXA40568.1 TonB-dependent receptor [Phenylobacterium sp.]
MKSYLMGASVAVLMATGASLANAQTVRSTAAGDKDVSEIVVTGSRIRTSPLDQDQPVIQIDQQTVANTGLTSTVDVLQRIPSAGGGLNGKFNNSGNLGNPPDGGGVGAGSAEIDLRYLSSRRVLVLVDGLRWVSGASASGVPGAVDLNTIPTEMISRMEVLQEGASPIYGSDAIAGVVNIITKEHQDGMHASAQVGGFGQGDGYSQDYNVSWGVNQEHTHAVLGGGYFRQEPVFSADRAISRFPRPYATSCLAGGCSSATPLGRFIITDPNTGQDIDATLRQALQPGQRAVYNPADPTGASGSFKPFTTADRFDFQPYNYILTPLERVSAFASVTQDLTDDIRLRVRASYVERKSANQAAPLPLFVGPDAGNGNLLDTVSIDRTNPYNPFGFTLQPGTYSFVGRRLVENGPRHYEQTVNTFNVTGTLEGDFKVADRTWHWDANAVWSRNHAEQTFTGNVNAARVQQALGPLAGCTGSCVPLNLFGGAGTITPAMLAFIGFTQQDSSQQELHDYSANLTGDVFDLPAGPLAFAAGLERRETSGYFQPDAIVAEGLSADIPAQPARGSISVNEAYGELRIPLLRDMPGFNRLDGSVAGRWFHYSTSGSDATYKAGLNWRPVDEVLLRGSWGQGFRAPSIGELYGSASRFDEVINDPCSGFLTSGVSATVRANCIAHGVPASGSYSQLNSQLPVITSGNVHLKPETSKSWDASLVWQPKALRDTAWSSGGSMEVAYSDITLDNAIQALNGQTLLDRCANTGDALSCATITRTASGTVSAITNPLINIGGIKTRAIDLNLVWTSPAWDFGQFSAHWYTTFLLNFTELQPTSSGLTEVHREGTERGSPDQAYPRAKSNLSVDWMRGQWGATGTVRYISSVTESGAPNRFPALAYFDAQVRWTPDYWGKAFTIAAGGNNLFDKDPPACLTCSLNNYDPNVYDAPGRFFYLRLSYHQ